MGMTKEEIDALRRSYKSISEAAGVPNRKERPIPINDREMKAYNSIDRQQAEIELTYIRAAIAIAEGSNDIGADITIGPLTIGVSLNHRLIPVLEAEAEEIEKYLRGEENNWE